MRKIIICLCLIWNSISSIFAQDQQQAPIPLGTKIKVSQFLTNISCFDKVVYRKGKEIRTYQKTLTFNNGGFLCGPINSRKHNLSILCELFFRDNVSEPLTLDVGDPGCTISKIAEDELKYRYRAELNEKCPIKTFTCASYRVWEGWGNDLSEELPTADSIKYNFSPYLRFFEN